MQYAKSYLDEKEGLCIASSADLFLGDYGCISSREAETVFPILVRSASRCLRNEEDWILESFTKIADKLGAERRDVMKRFATRCLDGLKKATRRRAERLLRLLGELSE